MCKKYKEYKILLNFKDGSFENVVAEDVNSCSYKEMLDFYNIIKEANTDNIECKNIEFWGVGEEIIERLWFKEFKSKIELISSDSILENVIKQVNLIAEREIYIQKQVCLLNKIQDVLLHQIEKFSGVGTEKIEIFSRLQEVRISRRNAKNEIKELNLLKRKLELTVENLSEAYNKINIKMKENEDKVDFFNKEQMRKIITIAEFDNAADKSIKIKHLQKTYKKFFVANKSIYAYNKGYACNF